VRGSRNKDSEPKEPLTCKDGGGNQTHVSLDINPGALSLSYIHPVGTAGFEPASSCTQNRWDTWLPYIPFVVPPRVKRGLPVP
jgi:hypothetical protein